MSKICIFHFCRDTFTYYEHKKRVFVSKVLLLPVLSHTTMSVPTLIPSNIHYEVVRLKSDFSMSNYLLLCGYFHFLFLRRFVHEFKQYHQYLTVLILPKTLFSNIKLFFISYWWGAKNCLQGKPFGSFRANMQKHVI